MPVLAVGEPGLTIWLWLSSPKLRRRMLDQVLIRVNIDALTVQLLAQRPLQRQMRRDQESRRMEWSRWLMTLQPTGTQSPCQTILGLGQGWEFAAEQRQVEAARGQSWRRAFWWLDFESSIG